MKFISRYSITLIAATCLLLSGCFSVDLFNNEPAPEPKRAPVASPVIKQAPKPVANTANGPYTVKIGLLLPLSGPSKDLGRSMQDAAFLALNDKYDSIPALERNMVRIVLIPKDTASSPERAAQAASELAREGVQVVMGPVFSAELERVAPILRGIPVISFSNNRAMAGNGIFLMGFRPEQQIERITSYAAEHGIKQIATLLPSDQYGQDVEATLKESCSRLSLPEPEVVYYNPASPSVKSEIKSLFEKNQAMGGSARYGFDALLIPAGGTRLNSILHEIASQGYDMKAFQLLGSGQWDDESVPVSSDAYGSWYAGTNPERRRTFQRHFLQSYTYLPERLASLSYDTTALVAALAYMGPGGITMRSMTDPNGFDGPVDGIFRFFQSGLSDRGLAILSVQPDVMKVLEPAPSSFASRP